MDKYGFKYRKMIRSLLAGGWKGLSVIRGVKEVNGVLIAEGVYKYYGRREILKGVNLTVSCGECVGIVGSNGCGKTTFLSILAGAVKADKGRISFDGKDVAKNRSDYTKAVAYVPQENPLIEELTVRDNLLLWYGGNKKAMERDLKSGAAAFLGIEPMIGRTVEKLSGGMKKRVSIACALCSHGTLLILDEPGAALDMECKADIRRYLEEYRKAGGAVVLTSHEMTELSVCTKIYVLKEGRLALLDNGLSENEMIQCFR